MQHPRIFALHHSSLFPLSRRRALIACVVLVSLSPTVALAAPGFHISGLDAVPTEEGGFASFTVALEDAPASDVSLTVTRSDPSEVNIFDFDNTPITASNWTEPRRYWIFGRDDEDDDGDVLVEITVEATPDSDPAYVALGPVTFDIRNYDDEETMTFTSLAADCNGPATEDIYQGQLISLTYDQTAGLDDRVFLENDDHMYLELRTLHVILQNTFAGNLTTEETEVLRQSYARAVHRIHTTSRGMVALDFDQVEIAPMYLPSSFVDDWPDLPGMQGVFADYQLLRRDLEDAGYDYDEYDMISVSVAFDVTEDAMPSKPAHAVLPDGIIGVPPYTNSTTWDNDRTMTTVQYVPDPESPGWIDIFIHEMFHNLEWMLEYGSYPELRNPDDPWWEDTYSYADVMDMFWARPKSYYFSIPDPWGTLHTRPATHIVEMSCPTSYIYKEKRVYCPNGVTCFLGCRCKTE